MRTLQKMMLLTVVSAMMITACGAKQAQPEVTAKQTETGKQAKGTGETVTIAAAASLERCLTEELIPLFEAKYPGIKVFGTYDSSGKLQTQIEEGADVDLFFCAATKQMTALKEKGMMADESIVDLLENKIVLIVPSGEEIDYKVFEDIVKADMIAIGDPESVPAGQYAREVLLNLGLWDQVTEKSTLGTNVTEVLNWVAEGSAQAGIVYATDAAQTEKVVVVAEAPEGSVAKVIYPVGITKASAHPEAAKSFIEFLQSAEAMAVFTDHGFASGN